MILKSRGDVGKMIELAVTDGSLSERELLLRLLEFTNWNQSRTAWILDISERTIRNWIRKYGLTRA